MKRTLFFHDLCCLVRKTNLIAHSSSAPCSPFSCSHRASRRRACPSDKVCVFCEFCVRLLYFLCADKFISRKIRRTRRLCLKKNSIYRLRCRWNPQTLSQASPRRLAQWQLCLPHGSAVKLAHFCGLTCSFIAVKTLIKSSVYSANFACDYYTSCC